MLTFFHPRPVVSGRAVAVQVVRQTVRAPVDADTVLVLPARPAPDSLEAQGRDLAAMALAPVPQGE